jgi:hypothetical protein
LSLPRELWLVGRNIVVVFGLEVVLVDCLVVLVGLGVVPKSPTFLPNSFRRPIFCLSFCLKSSLRLSFLVGGAELFGVVVVVAKVVGVVIWVVVKIVVDTWLEVCFVDDTVVITGVVTVGLTLVALGLLKRERSTKRLGLAFDLDL